jgi:hypothetical protein
MPTPKSSADARVPVAPLLERNPVKDSLIARRKVHSRSQRSVRGASFVELMLAVLVISTTVVASTASMHSSTEVYHYFADGQHEALMLAQEIHEAALLLPWDAEAGAPGQFGPDVAKLQDFDGKTFTPPRSAGYEVVVSNIDWTQEVEVNHVDLADPTVEVDPATFEGDTLTELKVTVKQGDVVKGVQSWWMTEPTHN